MDWSGRASKWRAPPPPLCLRPSRGARNVVLLCLAPGFQILRRMPWREPRSVGRRGRVMFELVRLTAWLYTWPAPQGRRAHVMRYRRTCVSPAQSGGRPPRQTPATGPTAPPTAGSSDGVRVKSTIFVARSPFDYARLQGPTIHKLYPLAQRSHTSSVARATRQRYLKRASCEAIELRLDGVELAKQRGQLFTAHAEVDGA